MASKSKAARANAANAAQRTAPYVQRVVQDEELRDNVRVAFEAARDAYERLTNGKAPTKVVLEDKKFQRDVQQAANALRDATDALRDGPQKQRRRGGLGRKLLVLLVGAGIAIAVSNDLRSKILDALFGKEEEFDYTSTTTPAPTPPAPAGAS
jgi:hypothetical protein